MLTPRRKTRRTKIVTKTVVIIPAMGRFCSGLAGRFSSLSIEVASIPALAPDAIRERPFAWRPTALGNSIAGVRTLRVPGPSPQKQVSDVTVSAGRPRHARIHTVTLGPYCHLQICLTQGVHPNPLSSPQAREKPSPAPAKSLISCPLAPSLPRSLPFHPEPQKSTVIPSEAGRRGPSVWRNPQAEGPAVAFAFAPGLVSGLGFKTCPERSRREPQTRIQVLRNQVRGAAALKPSRREDTKIAQGETLGTRTIFPENQARGEAAMKPRAVRSHSPAFVGRCYPYRE